MPSGAVTVAVTVQEPPALIVPNARLIVPVPAVAVAVPLQVEDRPWGLATTKPAGRKSRKPTPVSPPPTKLFGFEIWKLTTEVPPGTISTGVKNLLMIGGAITRTVAVDVLPV